MKILVLVILLAGSIASARKNSSRNFVLVSADTEAGETDTPEFHGKAHNLDFAHPPYVRPEIADSLVARAELAYDDYADYWLGKKLPKLNTPGVLMAVNVGPMGGGGATNFTFENGEVYGWRMGIQGTEERLLDSVVPHEVSHIFFALYFRKPLPRWADEGMATLWECREEKRRQLEILQRAELRYSMKDLATVYEYPKNPSHVRLLYAQGMILTEMLLSHGDPREGRRPLEPYNYSSENRKRFLQFINNVGHWDWERALRRSYDLSVAEAQSAYQALEKTLIDTYQVEAPLVAERGFSTKTN